jgi:hypothetical protein
MITEEDIKNLEKFKELFENRIETSSKKIEDKIEKKLEF